MNPPTASKLLDLQGEKVADRPDEGLFAVSVVWKCFKELPCVPASILNTAMKPALPQRRDHFDFCFVLGLCFASGSESESVNPAVFVVDFFSESTSGGFTRFVSVSSSLAELKDIC